MSARRRRHSLEFERYTVAACSMALMVLVVVGTVGYAGVRSLASSTAPVASATTTVEVRQQEADPDRVVTPTTLALALFAILAVVVAANPSRINHAVAPHR